MMGRAAQSNNRTGGWRCSSTGSPACCHSCPPPSCRATGRGDGWEGEGLGRWCLYGPPAHLALLWISCSTFLERPFLLQIILCTYHLQKKLENFIWWNNLLFITKILLVHNKGRVQHVEMGSNRVCTIRVRGEANVSYTALVCQLKTHSTLEVPHCRVPPNSAEFCGILPKSRISASSRQLARPFFSYPWYTCHVHQKAWTPKPVRKWLFSLK
jgi:hypothetical protein